MTGGTRQITASNSAPALGDVPATMNASSASDVRLAARYHRRWCGDMQGPPFARIEKPPETIAAIVRRAIAADDRSRSACRRGASRRPDRPATAPGRIKPCVESSQSAAGALSRTEHREVIQRNGQTQSTAENRGRWSRRLAVRRRYWTPVSERLANSCKRRQRRH
jgi:hypothetical protein